MSYPATSVENERTFVLISYVLHLLGSVAGITSIVGLVLNYLKRGGNDDVLASHHAWMIRSFWWAVLWGVIGWITIIILVGWAILLAVWVWYIYRHVRGLVAFTNGEPMPH